MLLKLHLYPWVIGLVVLLCRVLNQDVDNWVLSKGHNTSITDTLEKKARGFLIATNASYHSDSSASSSILSLLSNLLKSTKQAFVASSSSAILADTAFSSLLLVEYSLRLAGAYVLSCWNILRLSFKIWTTCFPYLAPVFQAAQQEFRSLPTAAQGIIIGMALVNGLFFATWYGGWLEKPLQRLRRMQNKVADTIQTYGSIGIWMLLVHLPLKNTLSFSFFRPSFQSIVYLLAIGSSVRLVYRIMELQNKPTVSSKGGNDASARPTMALRSPTPHSSQSARQLNEKALKNNRWFFQPWFPSTEDGNSQIRRPEVEKAEKRLWPGTQNHITFWCGMLTMQLICLPIEVLLFSGISSHGQWPVFNVWRWAVMGSRMLISRSQVELNLGGSNQISRLGAAFLAVEELLTLALLVPMLLDNRQVMQRWRSIVKVIVQKIFATLSGVQLVIQDNSTNHSDNERSFLAAFQLLPALRNWSVIGSAVLYTAPLLLVVVLPTIVVRAGVLVVGLAVPLFYALNAVVSHDAFKSSYWICYMTGLFSLIACQDILVFQANSRHTLAAVLHGSTTGVRMKYCIVVALLFVSFKPNQLGELLGKQASRVSLGALATVRDNVRKSLSARNALKESYGTSSSSSSPPSKGIEQSSTGTEETTFAAFAERVVKERETLKSVRTPSVQKRQSRRIAARVPAKS